MPETELQFTVLLYYLLRTHRIGPPLGTQDRLGSEFIGTMGFSG